MHRPRRTTLPLGIVVALLLLSVGGMQIYAEESAPESFGVAPAPEVSAPSPELSQPVQQNPETGTRPSHWGHSTRHKAHKTFAPKKAGAALIAHKPNAAAGSVIVLAGGKPVAVKAAALKKTSSKKPNPMARWMRPFASDFSLAGITLGHPTPLLGRYATYPETAWALLPHHHQAGHTRILGLPKQTNRLNVMTEEPIPQLQGNLLPKQPEIKEAPLKRLAAAIRPSSPESQPITPPVSPVLPEPVATSPSSFAAKTAPQPVLIKPVARSEAPKLAPLKDLPETEGNTGIPMEQVAEHQAENRPVTAGTLLRMLGALVIVLGLIAVAFKMRWFNWSGWRAKDGDLSAAQRQHKERQKKQFMQRLSIPAQHPDHPFEVLATTPLGENKEIHLVQVKNRYLVLGTSSSEHIQVLTEFNEPEEETVGIKEDATEALLKGLPQFVASHQAAQEVQAWHDEEKTQPITVIEEPSATVSLDPQRIIYQGELHAEEYPAPESSPVLARETSVVPPPQVAAGAGTTEIASPSSLAEPEPEQNKVFQDLAKRYAALASASAMYVTPKNDFEGKKTADEKAASRTPVAASSINTPSSDAMTGVQILNDYEDDEHA